jgi:hypothetical protein
MGLGSDREGGKRSLGALGAALARRGLAGMTAGEIRRVVEHGLQVRQLP